VTKARGSRTLLRQARSRYRRPIAALLAALATIVAITALRPSNPPAATTEAEAISLTRPGEVTVPVPLSRGGSAVDTGDVVDLVTIDDNGLARVIANDVVVTETTTNSGYSSDAVALISMSERDALLVTAAAGRAPLALIINPRSASPA
jgi:hypothetical protein